MNIKLIIKTLGQILRIEACLMLLPIICAILYQETASLKAYAICSILCLTLGTILTKIKITKHNFYAKEAFVTVTFSWIVLSLFGALPFYLTKDIPSYIDALFEIISGFTTTGSSILNDVECLSHANLLWRSFSHWIGGMGVIVFLLAIVPFSKGSTLNLLKAESPGPSVEKMVPKIKDTAMILYGMYMGLSLLQLMILLILRCPVFDAICITFGTAGTGGFGIKNDSLASYSIAIQNVTTIFMILFGVNFTFYFYLLNKKFFQAFGMEEVRLYIIIIITSIVLITINLAPNLSTLFITVKDVAFQVASIITTTGFSTVDFDLWPDFSRILLVILMFVGACAGSTGGGMKVSRFILAFKAIRKEIDSQIHPRQVEKITIDAKPVSHETIRATNVYFTAYAFIFVISVILISINNLGIVTSFTAVAATFNNIGPGLEMVGPAMNFSCMSNLSKFVLMFDMLCGRLELFPFLVTLYPLSWKKH